MIEIDLESYFQPEVLEEAFYTYKDAKRDRYKVEGTDPIEQIYKIPMGADGIDWQNYEKNLDRRVRSLSRAVLEGRYIFYPLREVEIEKTKKPGTKGKAKNTSEENEKIEYRTLSIASIRDILVQKQLYSALLDSSEEMFSAEDIDYVSFGYRPHKSIRHAARGVWHSFKREGFNFALDADLQKFFDTLDQNRLEDLIDEWVGLTSITGKLLKRFIHAKPISHATYKQHKRSYFKSHKPDYSNVRTKGVPQGGVLSGMLANLYLHSFDKWVVRELGSEIELRYFRYADDFIILTRSKEDTQKVYDRILPFLESLKLTMHPVEKIEKTKFIDIRNETNFYNNKSSRLKFVGFEFTADHIRIRPETVQRYKDRFAVGLFRERKFGGKDHWRNHIKPTIKYLVNQKITGPQPETCQTCSLPKKPARSWISGFAPVITDVNQIKELDLWMRKTVYKYFRDTHRVRLSRKQLRAYGMKSMVKEYYKRRRKETLCKCNLGSKD